MKLVTLKSFRKRLYSLVLICKTSVFFLIFFLCSCNSNSIPQEVIKPEKMKHLLFEKIMLDEYASSFLPNDSNRNSFNNDSMMSLICTHYQVTLIDFNKSYNYYQSHSSLMQQLVDSMLAIQQKPILSTSKKNTPKKEVFIDSLSEKPLIRDNQKSIKGFLKKHSFIKPMKGE